MATLVFRGLSLKVALDPGHARVLAEQVRMIMSSSLTLSRTANVFDQQASVYTAEKSPLLRFSLAIAMV